MAEADNNEQYEAWQKAQEKHWESLCTRCGACCGVKEGDPCEHLEELDKGRYRCSIYEHRFGERKTRSGRVFQCVPIRKILFDPWPGDECCGYKEYVKKHAIPVHSKDTIR